jgi:hypothetical protein
MEQFIEYHISLLNKYNRIIYQKEMRSQFNVVKDMIIQDLLYFFRDLFLFYIPNELHHRLNISSVEITIKGRYPNSIEIFKIDITESKDKIFDDVLSIFSYLDANDDKNEMIKNLILN